MKKKQLSKGELPTWFLVMCCSLLVLYSLVLLAADIEKYFNKGNDTTLQTNAPQIAPTENSQQSNIPSSKTSLIKEVQPLNQQEISSNISGHIPQNIPKYKNVIDANLSRDNQQRSATREITSARSNSTINEPFFSNSVNWLESQPKTNYSVQLASFSNKQSTLNFLNRQADTQNLHALESTNGWFYVLYGSYIAIEDAKSDSQRLSKPKQTAIIRNIGLIREKRCKNQKIDLNDPRC